MGITKNCVKFLLYVKKNGVSFDKTVMLGRQQLYVCAEEINEYKEKFDFDDLLDVKKGQFAEPLFKWLGASIIDSVDRSNFENATIIHDLNKPISDYLVNKYSVVFDGGTLEHIFNFPMAIKNCMDMLSIGGHFISITPTNNQSGHGFYQFSPELFFSVFSKRYGFVIKSVFLGVDQPDIGIQDWYAVADPHRMKQRVTFTNSLPSYLMVLAQKVNNSAEEVCPAQSDYQLVWDVHDSIQNNKPIQNEPAYMHWYRKYVPSIVKKLIRQLFSLKKRTAIGDIPDLGGASSSVFKKIDF
jgi:hypothetical protein